ncbi:MAG: hypothetical protein IKG03_07655 [Clostridiales bacterium]|nr:hypothetical protein [Clostridiales bacterium]
MKNLTAKILTLGLASVILTSGLTACKIDKNINVNANVKINGEEVISTHIGTGSWEIVGSSEITDALKKIFADATGELDGYFYEPVALLGTQLVSGTNYCFLCRSAVTAHDAADPLMLTYIYVDTQGKASFLKDDSLLLPGAGTSSDNAPVPGGWSNADSPEITEDVKKVLDKASETLTGVSYEAVAYAGSQVVAGTNHAILCKVTPSVSGTDSKASLALVYVYEDLQGNCEITDTSEVELGI